MLEDRADDPLLLGARDCTPEIDTSDIIVAFPNGLSVAFSKGISLFSGMFQRIVTCPVGVCWKCPMDVQLHVPIDNHFVISGG